MGSIIVAMPKQEDAKKISDILRHRGMETDALCSTGAGVLSLVQERQSGVVICATRFSDMYYHELAEYLPDYFTMILLTSKPDVDANLSNVVLVQMPFKAADLTNTVDMLLTQIRRRIKKQKSVPKQRPREEQELILKAKLLLMERNNMTEKEAFRYIQKCSMDSGTNMVETAQMILLLNYD